MNIHQTACAIVSLGKQCKIPATISGILLSLPWLFHLLIQDLFAKDTLALLLVIVSWVAGVSLWQNLRLYTEGIEHDDTSSKPDDSSRVRRLPNLEDPENTRRLAWSPEEKSKTKEHS